MIGQPHNDRTCLGAITDQIAGMVEGRDPALLQIAEQHDDPEALAVWIRTLPQRDDDGRPCDGPKVHACRPAQRLRIPADDPNCVERAALYLGAAELLDDGPVRRLATVNTPGGLHTFPTEDGAPVILDPATTRNAADIATRRLRLERLIGTDETRGVRGDLARARKSKTAGYTTWVDGEPIDDAIAKYERALATYQGLLDGLPRNANRHGRNVVTLTPTEAVDWIAEVAAEPAARIPGGPQRARNGHRALRALLVGRPICMAEVHDVAFVLALADREAPRHDPAGRRIVRTTAHAVDRLDRETARRWMDAQAGTRNAPSLQFGNVRVGPNVPLLKALGRVGGRLGMKVGVEALRVKLATLGVTPPVLNSIEQEMNREGLSLGALVAPPPMLGSLGSLTPEALAGRWLAQKF